MHDFSLSPTRDNRVASTTIRTGHVDLRKYISHQRHTMKLIYVNCVPNVWKVADGPTIGLKFVCWLLLFFHLGLNEPYWEL